MAKKISLIIPFFNEEENIHFLVESLSVFLSSQDEFKTEVIFVDDGSSDDSVRLLKKSKHQGYVAKLISLSRNFGSHAALRAGIMHATGDYITFMYADLQDPLELINKLFNECINGPDIAWACRNTSKNGFLEKAFSKIYSSLMEKFAINTYPENGFDIVMFNGKIQKIVNQNIEGNSSIFLQILTLGFKQTSIRYDKVSRRAGESKWTVGKKIKLFIDSFVAFSYAPIRFVTIVGMFLFVIGLFWSGYLIFRKVFVDDLVPGWTSVISILLLGFGISNISLGIIAEYLWRTLDTSRKRPVFIIDEMEEIKSPKND